MDRRRVLIIVENLPVPFDTRVWNEAATLAAAGYEVSVVSPVGDGFRRRFEVIEGVHVYRHPLRAAGRGQLGYVIEYALASFWQLWLACRILIARGFDVLHACNPPDTLFAIGLMFKVLGGKRFVFDQHDLSPELYTAKFGRRPLVLGLLQVLERMSYRAADVVLATNESVRRVALERGGVDARRIWVVRSGPTADRLRRVPPNAAWRSGRQYLVGYVGLMDRQDGLGYLVEAARHVVRDLNRPDVQFVLLGFGPELERLRARCVALGIDEHVSLPGRADGDQVLEMLSTADVCVCPDEVNAMTDKTTMIKTMEYMAAGKPIVQFETTEGRWTARDSALYARPNDARDLADKIVELLNDPARRQVMGAAGAARARGELAWSRQAANLLAAYDSCFAARP
jgi:glycosyltransferase involved in cell wall biosynthesis